MIDERSHRLVCLFISPSRGKCLTDINVKGGLRRTLMLPSMKLGILSPVLVDLYQADSVRCEVWVERFV